MTNPCEPQRAHQEEPSPSMSRNAEDNLSNSDGPLLAVKRRDKDLTPARSQMNSSTMLIQNNWHKNYPSSDEHYFSDEKKNHRYMWMLTAVLTFIGVCNLILNLTILIVLRVSQGMESLEVIPEQDLIKFYGNTDLDRVCLHKGICEGFGDEPIELTGDSGGVHIQVTNRHHSTTSSNVKILKNGTLISQVESFQVKDPRSGSTIFSTDFPHFGLPQGVKKIEVDVTQTHRISAPKTSDLSLHSNESISMHGAEGTTIDSKEIIWTAKNDIFLRSRNGDIIIAAKEGINVPEIPKAPASLQGQSNEMQEQFKVCVCMPDGKLFLIPVQRGNTKINCAKYSKSMGSDPCAL